MHFPNPFLTLLSVRRTAWMLNKVKLIKTTVSVTLATDKSAWLNV